MWALGGCVEKRFEREDEEIARREAQAVLLETQRIERRRAEARERASVRRGRRRDVEALSVPRGDGRASQTPDTVQVSEESREENSGEDSDGNEKRRGARFSMLD